MMTYQEAVGVVKQLIADRGRGFDWQVFKRHRYDISEAAKHLAVRVLDDPVNVIADIDNPEEEIPLAEALRKSIGSELHCNIHKDYVYRCLALALDDDSTGNHITVELLRLAKVYRINTLGMNY